MTGFRGNCRGPLNAIIAIHLSHVVIYGPCEAGEGRLFSRSTGSGLEQFQVRSPGPPTSRARALARRRDTREAARKKRLNIILLPRDTQGLLIRWLSLQSTQPPAGSFRGFALCVFDICPPPAIASACKADSFAAAERRFLRVHQCP